MTCLAVVIPALSQSGADAIQARKGWDFAKPATNIDALEVVRSTGGKDLGECSRVEFVDQAANAVHASLHGVTLEEAVLCEGGETAGCTIFRDNAHVPSVIRRTAGRRGW